MSGNFNDELTEGTYPVVDANPDMVSDFEEIKAIAESSENGKSIQIIDARPAGRWTGANPEPRAG